ncbi:MAG TPA: response regulator [Kofleriaceae bacterium]|nr:response regulator [Kofleriaceae bacterium]
MRILVVEDDHDFGEVVLDHLQRLGHDVVRANNAPQALSLVETFAPDVILIDIRLPIFDGNNIATAIHEHWTPRPRLIALTSLVDLVDTSLFDAWLEKPATVAAVSQALTDSFLGSAGAVRASTWTDDSEDTHP